jgi:hypothetical protein
MDAAQKIREAVSQVSLQRARCAQEPNLHAAVARVKRFQARRFAATYADLLAADPFRHAAQFFLDELYGDQDFARRDLQFSRIAGALQRIFPNDVVKTAVALAELHALTEQMDFAMGQAWLRMDTRTELDEATYYILAWRLVGNRDARLGQLAAVLELGREMDKLTHTPGLRFMLRMMRRPASAAGLGDLQRFLESGFDNFHTMAHKKGLSAQFLGTIERRESNWLATLFDSELVTCATKLNAALGQAPSR